VVGIDYYSVADIDSSPAVPVEGKGWNRSNILDMASPLTYPCE